MSLVTPAASPACNSQMRRVGIRPEGDRASDSEGDWGARDGGLGGGQGNEADKVSSEVQREERIDRMGEEPRSAECG